MHKPNHLFFTAEEVRIRAGLNGVCKITVAFVGGTDGRGLPPGTEVGVPDWSCSRGKMSTDVCRRLLSWFDWQPWKDWQLICQLFVRWGGFSVSTLET